VLFLDLDLHHVAGMLDDFRDVRLVTSSNFTRSPLGQVRKSTVHPVLPENTNTVAEWRKVGLDHAKGSVDRPEDKEDNEQMVCVPKSFEVGASEPLHRSDRNKHQCSQHDISTPSRPSQEVCCKEAFKSQVVDRCELCQVVPMRNGVHPGEEDDGPSDELVEGNVLVEWNDAVQWRFADHGYQVPANRKEDERHVYMEHQRGRTGDRKRDSKDSPRADGFILGM